MDVLIQQYKEGVINPEIIVSHYVTIKDYYVAVSYVLKTYDRQFYKETLEKIHTTMIELRKKREPKRKFKFSRRNEDFGVQ